MEQLKIPILKKNSFSSRNKLNMWECIISRIYTYSAIYAQNYFPTFLRKPQILCTQRPLLLTWITHNRSVDE